MNAKDYRNRYINAIDENAAAAQALSITRRIQRSTGRDVCEHDNLYYLCCDCNETGNGD